MLGSVAMTNVFHFDEKSKADFDAKRAARLWKDMEESLASWEGLARGATHKRRLDPRGSVAAVYAYGAYVMRRIKRKSVDALFLKKAAEDAVCEQMLSDLGVFQAECESAVQARAATRGVSSALTACLFAVSQMRLSAGSREPSDRKVGADRAKAASAAIPLNVRLRSVKKPRKKAAKRTR